MSSSAAFRKSSDAAQAAAPNVAAAKAPKKSMSINSSNPSSINSSTSSPINSSTSSPINYKPSSHSKFLVYKTASKAIPSEYLTYLMSKPPTSLVDIHSQYNVYIPGTQTHVAFNICPKQFMEEQLARFKSIIANHASLSRQLSNFERLDPVAVEETRGNDNFPQGHPNIHVSYGDMFREFSARLNYGFEKAKEALPVVQVLYNVVHADALLTDPSLKRVFRTLYDIQMYREVMFVYLMEAKEFLLEGVRLLESTFADISNEVGLCLTSISELGALDFESVRREAMEWQVRLLTAETTLFNLERWARTSYGFTPERFPETPKDRELAFELLEDYLCDLQVGVMDAIKQMHTLEADYSGGVVLDYPSSFFRVVRNPSSRIVSQIATFTPLRSVEMQNIALPHTCVDPAAYSKSIMYFPINSRLPFVSPPPNPALGSRAYSARAADGASLSARAADGASLDSSPNSSPSSQALPDCPPPPLGDLTPDLSTGLRVLPDCPPPPLGNARKPGKGSRKGKQILMQVRTAATYKK